MRGTYRQCAESAQSYPESIRLTVQRNIQTVSKLRGTVLASPANIASHNADNTLARYISLDRDAIVTENIIPAVMYGDYPVQHIGLRRAGIQHDIPPAAELAGMHCANGKGIPALSYQREHADTDIPVCQLAVFLQGTPHMSFFDSSDRAQLFNDRLSIGAQPVARRIIFFKHSVRYLIERRIMTEQFYDKCRGTVIAYNT